MCNQQSVKKTQTKNCFSSNRCVSSFYSINYNRLFFSTNSFTQSRLSGLIVEPRRWFTSVLRWKSVSHEKQASKQNIYDKVAIRFKAPEIKLPAATIIAHWIYCYLTETVEFQKLFNLRNFNKLECYCFLFRLVNTHKSCYFVLLTLITEGKKF